MVKLILNTVDEFDDISQGTGHSYPVGILSNEEGRAEILYIPLAIPEDVTEIESDACNDKYNHDEEDDYACQWLRWWCIVLWHCNITFEY